MKPCNPILSSLGDTIFDEMSRLSDAHKAINLGQGVPEDPGPAVLLEACAKATLHGSNQYPSMRGTPTIRQALSRHDQRFYGLSYDWQSEIIVTAGATEALAACLFSLLEVGDEAIIIEPAYDCYVPIINLSGATPVYVTLEAPDWSLPLEALRAAFSDKTKVIVLNTPHNPTGKVFNASELAEIAALAKKHDAYVLCDEVYEHLVYDGLKHLPIASLPDMRDRCLRVGSAGKTFSVTGWKIGYVSGPEALISVVLKAHQFLSFTQPPNLQDAVAVGLDMDDAFYEDLARGLESRRDLLAAGLRGIGFAVGDSKGTYFLTTDIRQLDFSGTDHAFCHAITKQAGVTAIPVSAFQNNPKDPHMVRFCFTKSAPVLHQAIERLTKYFKG